MGNGLAGGMRYWDWFVEFRCVVTFPFKLP
jgi:hypothetical protein